MLLSKKKTAYDGKEGIIESEMNIRDEASTISGITRIFLTPSFYHLSLTYHLT